MGLWFKPILTACVRSLHGLTFDFDYLKLIRLKNIFQSLHFLW
jgi:hypothetical protein